MQVLTDFHGDKASFERENSKISNSQKNWVCQNRQFSNVFCENFMDYIVPGLVWLIDNMGIDVAQPIWLWGWVRVKTA